MASPRAARPSPVHTSTGATPPPVEVFWRPGSRECLELRGLLLDHDVAAVWRNIWTDPDARIALRAVNYGDETVPTVRVQSHDLVQSLRG